MRIAILIILQAKLNDFKMAVNPKAERHQLLLQKTGYNKNGD